MNKINKQLLIKVSLIVLLVGGIIFNSYYFSNLYFEIKNNILNLEKKISEISSENIKLIIGLRNEKNKNKEFESQINEITGIVKNLNKLVKTDEELLQKYSKVYFLNEHYVPSELSEIPEVYIYEKGRILKIHTNVLPFLNQLMKSAESDNIDLKIISAYRSFGEQSILKSEYSVVYGVGANKFSADQGYSEHQLGTAIDFTTSKTGPNFLQFKNTESYIWLQDNAYKFGFILSYPKKNEYYEYEPWHWRFVGTNLAKRLKEDNENFYNLNQSFIDAYLLSIFD